MPILLSPCMAQAARIVADLKYRNETEKKNPFVFFKKNTESQPMKPYRALKQLLSSTELHLDYPER